MRREILDRNIRKFFFQYLELKRKERLTKLIFGSDKEDINVRAKFISDSLMESKLHQNVRSVKLRSFM